MDIAFGLVMMLPKICFNKIILGVNKIYEQKYLTQDYFINHKKLEIIQTSILSYELNKLCSIYKVGLFTLIMLLKNFNHIRK